MTEKEAFAPSLSVSGHLGTRLFLGDSAAGSFHSLSQHPPLSGRTRRENDLGEPGESGGILPDATGIDRENGPGWSIGVERADL